MSITVKSSTFASGQPIPAKYTADGQDISPPLSWSDVPAGTEQFALIVDDPDAPRGTWIHWVVYGIPGDATSLPEGAGAKGKPAAGLLEGRNSWGKPGWGGPSPPSGTHRHYFRVYALGAEVKLKEGLTEAELTKAIEGHVLGMGELMGTYRR